MTNITPQHRKTESRAFQRLKLVNLVPSIAKISFKPCFAASLILLAGVLTSSAANVSLNASDAAGSSSFTTVGHWNNSTAPTNGNAYFTANFVLRTPAPSASGSNYIFGGDSLSIDAGGRLLGKIGNNVGGNTTAATLTVSNFVLNGGVFDQAGVINDNASLTVAGNVSINAPSSVGAIGGTANGSASFETLDFTAAISGSAALQVSGAGVNGGQASGVVRLSAANPYSGTITVSNGVIASAANRLLQLNNVDAVSNATLNLTAVQSNSVSFASTANTGSFNVGALAGKSSQTLVDTAGSPIILNVGGNNASSSYTGALMDAGALVKTGSGTMTLFGTNAYTGNTTISNGTLALALSGSVSNSPLITVASGATFDVSATSFTLGAGQSLAGNGTNNGSVNTVSSAKIYAGDDGTYGTNTFTSDLTLAAGALINLDLGALATGANDVVSVGGNLVLNSTIFHLKAPNGSINLDASGDYTLVTVTGDITGTAASTPVWDVAPLNAANFSIVQNGSSIKLHFTDAAPPVASGTVSPSAVTRNQNSLVSVTVTSSSHPIATVTVDASSIGGSASLPLIAAGGGIYTNTIAAGPGITPGDKTLVATVTDTSSLSGTTPGFTLTISAGSEVWNGAGANDNWSSNPNWASGAAPGYAGDTLTFAGTTRLTPNMDTSYSVTDVNFDSSAGSFVIGTSGGTLTVTGSGVVNNSAIEQTLNVPIATAAPVTFNAAVGNLTVGGSITNRGNAVTFSGASNTTINRDISGSGGLSKQDFGTLILNGTNTFTGNISINSGTLQIAGAGLLGGGNYSGNITNLGVFQYSSSATQTLSGVISFIGVLKDGPGKLTLAGANTYFGDTIISNGVLQITGSLGGGSYTANITDNGTLQYSSAVNQTLAGMISGSGGVVKDGSGTLTLNGPNAYDGATVVTAGTLVFNPATVSYPTINSLSISNAAVTVNVNPFASLPVGSLILNQNAKLNLNYDFSAGNPTVAAVGVLTNLLVPGANISINISGPGAAVSQFPLISYSGAALPNLNNFSLGILPPGVTATLVNNTGNHSIDLNVTADVPATWISLTANDAFAASSFNSSGTWSDGNPPSAANGYYTKAFTLRTPADTNPYTFGGTALSIDTGARFIMKGINGQVITVPNLILNGGLVDFANLDSDNFTETLAGNITLQPGLTNYIGAVAGGGTETLFVTATINGSGNLRAGGVGVVVNDTGTVVLAGTNTYTGSTTVGQGILLINGAVGSTSITIVTNSTLGGIGTIGGGVAVQAGGRLAPGIPARGALTASLGTLSVGNTVMVDGVVLMRIDRAAITNSDQLVAPSVVVNPGASLTVNNLGSTNLAAGDSFTLFSTPVSGSFATVTLPSLPAAGLAWTNKLAENGTIAVISTGTVNPSRTNITVSVSGSSLSLSWPADHTGWTLQVQTNSLAVGLSTNWVDVVGSTATNSIIIPIGSTNGVVFYRLKL